jgi:hypothetical protein
MREQLARQAAEIRDLRAAVGEMGEWADTMTVVSQAPGWPARIGGVVVLGFELEDMGPSRN